jgi:hypothetical protein
LRNLQKCKACGFPVSKGRTFCVECEEKQWRGQRLAQLAARAGSITQPQNPQVVVAAQSVPEISAERDISPGQPSEPAAEAVTMAAPAVEDMRRSVPQNVPEDVSGLHNSALFSSSSASSGSWFSGNQYVLGALLVVAIVIGVIAWLR